MLRHLLLGSCLATVMNAASGISPVEPLPHRVPAKMADALDPAEPTDVFVGGWLGARIDANVTHRLAVVDTTPLLAGFQHRPGEHPWIGEHIGKWLHAATLAWAYTGDPALRAKLDDNVRALLATQEADGYLGTYAPDKRFGLYPDADWDVWVHKYDLIGLLTYYRYTGNEAALTASRRIGDLLIRTFPSKRSILAAGTHVGMAATSVLEPMVELYRCTGDERYLQFADYLVRAYEEPGGPDLVRSLLDGHGVDHTANGKAYEMMSNLVGLCELARATGNPKYLEAVENGWGDIRARRLYLTGTASTHEHFGADHELPNESDADVGETCVSVTWLQLNLQLLRLTGKVDFADEIERTEYNHLTAAQNPRGDDWCYFTPLQGKKPYDSGITCCHSSGPRGLALAPTAAYLQSADTLVVDTLETSRARFKVNGAAVEIEQISDFPREGRSTLVVHSPGTVHFALRIRVPTWAAPFRINGAEHAPGWAEIPAQDWPAGERIELSFNLAGHVVRGDYGNYGKDALTWGPFVLAADEAMNPKLGQLSALRVLSKAEIRPAGRDQGLRFTVPVLTVWEDTPKDLTLVPFADAGASGAGYRVWLRGM
ncbi:MAG TPA: beta-L-arabinofuranosidase domain-containing protein [Candidatus Didemnitutus sp.]|nr:beta-L-arabinofuranosidase domain-containing protein [Candidatus Didemnitutus sp.]